MADVAVNGNGNGQAVSAVAFGAHPDDDEIAEIDDAVHRHKMVPAEGNTWYPSSLSSLKTDKYIC